METANNSPAPLLEMKNIMKVYGNGVVANRYVNFSINKGEIHGLLGENGAGKSTLMKVLYGLETPEEGEILFNNQPIVLHSPLDALEHGIGMVHQHFMLLESLSITENIILGKETTHYGFLDNKTMLESCEKLIKQYNFNINPRLQVSDVSVGVKQKVEILKVLYRGVDVIILDEPTAILTPQETEELFIQLKGLKEQGITIIFISHKLDEVKELCDHITIMRQGKTIGKYHIDDLTTEEISNRMVGRDVVLTIKKEKATPQSPVLQVRNLLVKDVFGLTAVNQVSFDVRGGEILGIAGVEGNGQTELVDAITGFIPFQGDIFIKGESLQQKSIRAIRNLGLGHIPEDRMSRGFASHLSIEDNLLINMLDEKAYRKGIFINFKKSREAANQLQEDFQILAPSVEQEVGMLSGGNIQKVVVARELQKELQVLIANQPTRGVDVGAAEFIKGKIIEKRDEGVAVLMVSADLNEIFEVCDSLMVMHKGKIVAYFPNIASVSKIELGEYMLGVKKMDDVGGVVYEG